MQAMTKKRGQVWVETVLYTLIGIAIIGVLLAVSKPKIDEIQDRALIEQTIESLNTIDAKILEVQRVPGNVRVLELKISEGDFNIIPEENRLEWVIDSSYQYSELDEEINFGGIKILTTGTNPYRVKVSSNYSVNITLSGMEESRTLSSAPTPYLLRMESMGSNAGNIEVDLSID